ncbi:MAG TPA: hypothetical protein VHT71_04540 [Methylomirabilota bacterium]|nr:hypothetical protein [Methylomirabilota bacterium]
MLKIVTTEKVGRTVLELEGQIRGPWIDELARTIGRRGSDGALALDLARVTFIERRGVELLRGLGSDGVALLNCTPFVAEQLRAS